MSKPEFVMDAIVKINNQLREAGFPDQAIGGIQNAVLNDEDMYYETEQQARLHISVRLSHYASELSKAAADVLVDGERK